MFEIKNSYVGVWLINSILLSSNMRFNHGCRWDSASTVGDFDGHSKQVLSCAFKPTRPFRIVTGGEDFMVNFYQGPPFKFLLSHRLLN